MKELNISKDNFELIDLKNNPIESNSLEEIKNNLNCSYEDLFNKRSRKYNKENFNSDNDFKEGILKEYTFIKRPIISIKNNFFVGNSKKIIDNAKKEISNN